jgi:ACS family glucarate transporter-like MFS transporter
MTSWLPKIRVRWWIYAYMFMFAAMAYVQRTSIAVSAPEMQSELHFTDQQLGWLFFAFTTVYALCQLPGGALGQRLGPRIVFTAVGILGLLATLTTPLFPTVLGGYALLLALMAGQAVLGASQGPVFPVFAAVVERWFPARQFAMANGVVASGMLLGGALTPPLLVELTAYYGWKGAILWTALPAALLTAGWAWYGRDRPQQHPKVTAEEITELDEAPAAPPLTFRRMGQVLVNRNILLLALSYLCMNYVFYMISYWSFLYLVKERHLSGLESGLMAMAPWIGAAVGAAIGGVMADGLVIRMGATRGYRLLPLLTLPIGAVLLYLTPTIASVYVAVAALTVAFFAMEVNEGPYWAATMNVARADTGAATGVLNTGGNMGGMLCQPVVAALAAAGAWHGVWISGAVFAALAAVLWLFVNAEPAEAVAK